MLQLVMCGAFWGDDASVEEVADDVCSGNGEVGAE